MVFKFMCSTILQQFLIYNISVMEEVSTDSTADWGGKSTHRDESTIKNISAEVTISSI